MISVRPMMSEDWPEVRRIYEEGIATDLATFETSAPAWPDWNEDHLDTCRFVAVQGGRVAGWAALSGVSDRCVYAGVAEVSVYVSEDARGKGVGRALLEALARPPNSRTSGRCKRASSRKTRAASRSTSAAAFASSGGASGSES